MKTSDWLDAATKKILFRPDRKAVRKELEAHLEDLREASGLDEEAALEKMGDPEAIAEELGRLHRPWLGYLWRASQLALLGAAVIFCLVQVLLVRPPRSYEWLPIMRLYNYLQEDTGTMAALYLRDQLVLEERELSSGAVLETGGYTIRNDRTVHCQVSEEDGPQWYLYIDLEVTMSRWEEPLNDWLALPDIRTDTGSAGCRSITVNWGFWQKCALRIDLPEDAEWVEVDFGYGELKRTMHIDLTEEAET